MEELGSDMNRPAREGAIRTWLASWGEMKLQREISEDVKKLDKGGSEGRSRAGEVFWYQIHFPKCLGSVSVIPDNLFSQNCLVVGNSRKRGIIWEHLRVF